MLQGADRNFRTDTVCPTVTESFGVDIVLAIAKPLTILGYVRVCQVARVVWRRYGIICHL